MRVQKDHLQSREQQYGGGAQKVPKTSNYNKHVDRIAKLVKSKTNSKRSIRTNSPNFSVGLGLI